MKRIDLIFRVLFFALVGAILACFVRYLMGGHGRSPFALAVLLLGMLLNIHVGAFYRMHEKRRAILYFGIAALLLAVSIFFIVRR